MTALSLQDYRRIFASTRDEEVACWYLGATFACLREPPDIQVLQAETIMVYRPQTIDAHRCIIHWWEIGYFRDPTTGEIADGWLNPVTGARVDAPRTLEEGPGYYTVTQTDDGLTVEQTQPFADVLSVTTAFSRAGDQVRLDQVETKRRAFRVPDGTVPDLNSPAVSLGRTRLNLNVAADALLGAASSMAPSSGAYSFELDTLPQWMGFAPGSGTLMIRGTMQKAAMDRPPNKGAWERLKSLFPQYFDGDRLTPPWRPTAPQ